MPRPRTLPDADGLHQLRVVEGKTFDEIAEMFHVTRQAVYLAARKSGLTKPREKHDKNDVPWTVAEAHKNDWRLAQLRMAARLKHGKPVPERRRRYVENWVKMLEESNVVLDYDRDFYPDGFAYVPREPTDEWIVRLPEPTDNHD